MEYSLKMTNCCHKIFSQYEAIQEEVYKYTKSLLQGDSKTESTEPVWSSKAKTDESYVVDLQSMAEVSSQVC
jgi:hypothetical protein